MWFSFPQLKCKYQLKFASNVPQHNPIKFNAAPNNKKLAQRTEDAIIWISTKHVKHNFSSSLTIKRSAMQDWWLNTEFLIAMITNDTRWQGDGYEHCLPSASAAKQNHIKKSLHSMFSSTTPVWQFLYFTTHWLSTKKVYAEPTIEHLQLNPSFTNHDVVMADGGGDGCFQLCLMRLRGGPIGGICWVARALNASAIRWGWDWIIDFHPEVSITSVACLQQTI
jgi:hypothetical protein